MSKVCVSCVLSLGSVQLGTPVVHYYFSGIKAGVNKRDASLGLRSHHQLQASHNPPLWADETHSACIAGMHHSTSLRPHPPPHPSQVEGRGGVGEAHAGFLPVAPVPDGPAG